MGGGEERTLRGRSKGGREEKESIDMNMLLLYM